MIDHISLGTSDLERARAFYDALLAPLGFVAVWAIANGVGYGAPGGGDKLAIKLRPGAHAGGAGLRVVLAAPSAAAVDAALAAGLAHGGLQLESSEARGYRAHLTDPDGHAIQLVFAGVLRGV
ncbi:MAG: VOC family protein [Polyangiaceae bacterium]